MPAQIRREHSILRRQSVTYRIPEFVINGEGMKENNGKSATSDFIVKLDIVTAYLHADRIVLGLQEHLRESRSHLRN